MARTQRAVESRAVTPAPTATETMQDTQQGMSAVEAIEKIRGIADMDMTDAEKFRMVRAVLAETDAG